MDVSELRAIQQEAIDRYQRGPKRQEAGFFSESEAEYEARAARWRHYLKNFIRLVQREIDRLEEEDGPRA